MPNYMPASEAVIARLQCSSPTTCYIKCKKEVQCGTFMFNQTNTMCYLVDKDYQVCDENIGV